MVAFEDPVIDNSSIAERAKQAVRMGKISDYLLALGHLDVVNMWIVAGA